ncbi:hypothetical protein ACSQ67_001987 [Phaseolus vulgaris]
MAPMQKGDSLVLMILDSDCEGVGNGNHSYYESCAPGNAKHLEQPVSICDPYSNPKAQEIVQLLLHPIWDSYGYPTKKEMLRTWELDVEGLSSRLYFHHVRASIDTGTEIFIGALVEVASGLGNFDVILAEPMSKIEKLAWRYQTADNSQKGKGSY